MKLRTVRVLAADMGDHIELSPLSAGARELVRAMVPDQGGASVILDPDEARDVIDRLDCEVGGVAWQHGFTPDAP